MKVVIQVIYAMPGAQEIVEIELQEGAQVKDAINASGITLRHPEIDWGTQKIGVWGRPVTPTTLVRDCDRVEIYRALTADPKQARRSRAAVEHKRNRRR